MQFYRSCFARSQDAMETEDTSSKLHEPSIECIDCSYGYEDAQNLIDDLREIAWRAYFIGVIGDTDCYSARRMILVSLRLAHQ